jgi:hypothetical protein
MRGLPDLRGLEGLQGKIERWRQGRRAPKSPMPEDLWREATAAAMRLGTGRVARSLGLGYAGLKQRVLSKETGRGAVPCDAAPLAGRFIELPRLPGTGSTIGDAELVVEIVATDGTRLTVRAKEAGPSVLALIHAFRGNT